MGVSVVVHGGSSWDYPKLWALVYRSWGVKCWDCQKKLDNGVLLQVSVGNLIFEFPQTVEAMVVGVVKCWDGPKVGQWCSSTGDNVILELPHSGGNGCTCRGIDQK